MKKLFFAFLLLLPLLSHAQQRIVFVDSVSKAPIEGISVYVGRQLILSDSSGQVQITDTSTKLFINHQNFGAFELFTPFPDTLFLKAKPYELPTVEMKVGKWYKKNWRKSDDRIVMHEVYLVRANLTWREFSKLVIPLGKKGLRRVPPNTNLKIEFYDLNYKYIDIVNWYSKLGLVAFRKIHQVPKIPVPNKCYYTKTINLSELKDNEIELLLDEQGKQHQDFYVRIYFEDRKSLHTIDKKIKLFKWMECSALELVLCFQRKSGAIYYLPDVYQNIYEGYPIKLSMEASIRVPRFYFE